MPRPAADEASVAGHWVGEVELPGTKLSFDVDLALKPDGTWSGDISIPMQNAKDLTLGNISVKGKDVSFEIAGVPGNPTLKGTLSEDGQKITGQFMQGGQTFPCSITREAGLKDKAKQALAGFDAIVDKGLEGLKVPGVAVAIIVEDEVVLAKGYGFKDLENKVPMTPDTLLAIGSSSKAFSAEAVAEFRKAVDLGPRFAELRTKLAIALRERGDYDTALLEFQEALKVNPKYVPAYLHLGMTYYMRGLVDRAERVWKTALKATPDDKSVQVYLEFLKERRKR